MTDHTKTQVPGVALSERAMIVSLNIRQWAGRKLDKRVTDETNRAHNADDDAGRYNKMLLSKDALKEIQKIVGKARNECLFHTAPWLNSGGRILPAAGYDKFMADIDLLKGKFNAAISKFIAGYQDYVDESRVRLNGMFNESDYPSTDEIKHKFSFDLVLMPIPAAGDFRVDIPNQAEIQAQIEHNANAAIDRAMESTWERISECVTSMAEKLAAYEPASGEEKAKNVFRDSLVTNLQDLIAILPGLNLTNDPKLEKVTHLVQMHLCEHDAKSLRDDPQARQSTAVKAKQIQDAMSQFI